MMTEIPIVLEVDHDDNIPPAALVQAIGDVLPGTSLIAMPGAAAVIDGVDTREVMT